MKKSKVKPKESKMTSVELIRKRYPRRIKAEIFNKDGGSTLIEIGFVMEENRDSIRVKTCTDGQKDEWTEITIPKNRSKIMEYRN